MRRQFRITHNDFSGGSVDSIGVPENENDMVLLENVLPDGKQGLIPLPEEEVITEITNQPFDKNLKIHTIIIDKKEIFHLFIDEGRIKVVNEAFVEVPVLDFNFSSEYIKTWDAKKDISCCTIGNLTFVADTTVRVEKKIDEEAPRFIKAPPFVWFKELVGKTRYTIKISYGRGYDPRQEVVSLNLGEGKANETISNIKGAFKILFDKLKISYKLMANGFYFPGAKKVVVEDELSGKGISAINGFVQDISELPSIGIEGKGVVVSSSSTTRTDNFYLVYTDGMWQETLGPESQNYMIDPDTMPRVVERNGDFNRNVFLIDKGGPLDKRKVEIASHSRDDVYSLASPALEGYIFAGKNFVFRVDKHFDYGLFEGTVHYIDKNDTDEYEVECVGHGRKLIVFKYYENSEYPGDEWIKTFSVLKRSMKGKRVYKFNDRSQYNTIQTVGVGSDNKLDWVKFTDSVFFDKINVFTFDEENEYFVIKAYDWGKRGAGNSENNPLPNFVGKKITSLFYWKDRLGIASGENVALSRQMHYGQFFRTTTASYDEVDSINITLLDQQITPIHHVINFKEYVVLFTSNSQFKLEGSPLTYRTISKSILSRELIKKDIKPILYRDNIIAVTSDGRIIAMQEGPDRTLKTLDLSKKFNQSLRNHEIEDIFAQPQLESISVVLKDKYKSYLCLLGNQSPAWISMSTRGNLYYEYVHDDKLYRMFYNSDNNRVEVSTIVLPNRFNREMPMKDNRVIIPVCPRDYNTRKPVMFDLDKIFIERVYINGIAKIEDKGNEEYKRIAESMGITLDEKLVGGDEWQYIKEYRRNVVLKDITRLESVIIEGYYHD